MPQNNFQKPAKTYDTWLLILQFSNLGIESHIHSIKQKYGFPDRVAMKKYLIAKGHDGLEKFFCVFSKFTGSESFLTINQHDLIA